MKLKKIIKGDVAKYTISVPWPNQDLIKKLDKLHELRARRGLLDKDDYYVLNEVLNGKIEFYKRKLRIK